MSKPNGYARSGHKLRVDPIGCRAHGLCAELLPEVIDLDEWGYPIIRAGGVSADQIRDAREAVAACPTLALRLVAEKP